MAFTRKLLKSFGLTDEQIESTIEAHVEVTDAQKATISELTEKLAKFDEIQKELEEVKKGDWQKKFTDKEKEFSEYKAAVESKEREAAVKKAYRELLVSEKVGERQLDAVMRATNFSDMKLDADGKLENIDALKETIKKDWGGFITTERTKGADVANPPKGNDGGANSRAAELARKFQEMRYGKAPESSDSKN